MYIHTYPYNSRLTWARQHRRTDRLRSTFRRQVNVYICICIYRWRYIYIYIYIYVYIYIYIYIFVYIYRVDTLRFAKKTPDDHVDAALKKVVRLDLCVYIHISIIYIYIYVDIYVDMAIRSQSRSTSG